MASHQLARQALTDVLDEFDISDPTDSEGPKIKFVGEIPHCEQTHSEKLNLSLVGTIPSLANAVAAAQIYEVRGGSPQCIQVDLRRGHNYIDPDIGMTPSLNGQEITLDLVVGNPFLKNIFETKDGRWIVLSAVYVDLVYKWSAFLGCSIDEQSVRESVKTWNAAELESAATAAGLPAAICRTENDWASHPQGAHLATNTWVPSVRTSNSSAASQNTSSFLPSNPSRPLSGLRVISLTHAIAGPSAGRTLAEHGASVLQIMFTHGFEHPFVYTYANLGTASSRLNLNKPADREQLRTLVRDAHVWIDSYRPEAISKFGFGDEDIRKLNPSMIICRVRCYGTTGPWASKPGFDMQGSASSGMMSYMGEGVGNGKPQWPPGMVINDYTTGYSAALAIQSIILKRLNGRVDASDGWNVSPSLAGTAMAILRHFKTNQTTISMSSEIKALPPRTLEGQTSLGYLKTLAPLPEMSVTPIVYEHGLLYTMGSCAPVFPGYGDYDVKKVEPVAKHEVLGTMGIGATRKLHELRLLAAKYHSQAGCIKHTT